ncbi:AtpZ/AtpI family protein [Pedobacter polaris]|uniref:AtpZ/AtpI family protein n=1 Tax=Pedobacter polaris TaxID=2571273 RepID=A0A4V5P365_9SPHI|nr:AtpZ/AtpI family protein [Pedobacter polaris]TKC12202.1 AtpZ/AtpI family protein [Pedobacter polaris]
MTNSDDNQPKKQATNFAKYTGIAFQMLATIGLLVFIGYKIDEHQKSAKPIFTAILGLLGVIISLVQVVRSLNKNK